jgi:hypothetical protein
MAGVLNKFSIMYSRGIKILFAFPVVFAVVLGALFYVVAHYTNLISIEAAQELDKAAIIMFSLALFILFVYWLFLPQKVYVLQDRIRIRFGRFHWNIPFKKIDRVEIAKKIKCKKCYNLITCLKVKIEIVRKKGKNIRISPAERDQFLGYVERSMFDWKQTHKE